MGRKSYRERYFEEHEVVRENADNRKGYRIRYRYTGNYIAWHNDKHTAKQYKLCFAVLELISVGLFVHCAWMEAPVNQSRIAGGFGMLALIPWLLEISGILRYIMVCDYAEEAAGWEIDQSIRTGSLLRAVLLVLSGVSGLVDAALAGQMSGLDILLCAGILASAFLGIAIRGIYATQMMYIYRNKAGKPGKRY